MDKFKFRRACDVAFKSATLAAALMVLAVFFTIIAVLTWQSRLSIGRFGVSFLVNDNWNPVANEYGALVPIVGTLATTAISLLIAVPFGLGIALFLAEITPSWLKLPFGMAIELLAAIPSIVFGMWGLFVLSPLIAEHVQPFLKRFPGGPLFSGPCMGIGLMTSGVVLALMILPFVSSVARDVFLMVPNSMKEAAYGLGCTRWEVVKSIVIPYGGKGVAGAVFLGMGRALGETMAVTFVIGNSHSLGWSLFAPSASIASTLANEFTEADGALYLSSLVELGLVLFLITFVILGLARIWLKKGVE